MLPLIALRNLSRNRRRTLLSLIVVSVGVTSLLLTLGFIRYSFQGLSQAIIRGGLAHLEIAPQEAGDPSGASLGSRAGMPPAFHDWRAIRDRLEHRDGITAVSAAIQLAGMLMNGDRTVAFVGAALEPARLHKMAIEVKIRAGGKLHDDPPAAGEDQVLLGVELANTLGAKPGDSIVAIFTPGDPNFPGAAGRAKLDAENKALSDGLKANPTSGPEVARRAEEMEASGKILVSGVMGLFPMANEGLLRDMQAMAGGEGASPPPAASTRRLKKTGGSAEMPAVRRWASQRLV